MKAFYEEYRDEQWNISVHRKTYHCFPSHFHLNMELLIVRRGEYTVTDNDVSVKISDGEIMVFDSYNVHSYDEQLRGEDSCVVIFPYRLLSEFNARRGNDRIVQPKIKDSALVERLLNIVDTYLVGEQSEYVKETAVELMLSLLFEKLQFCKETERDEVALVRKILAYIQKHYREDATLKTLSKELGYTREHISKVFHRYVKKGLSQYVNGLRLEYIERLRAQGDTRSIVELLYEAGFKSQQTYYRFKKSVTK